MSRIGKQQLTVPAGVEITLGNNAVSVKGPKGTLERLIRDEVEITITDGIVTSAPRRNDKFSRALWGTYMSHINNMLTGVVTPFEKKLLVEGVGFKWEVKGTTLHLALGFSHPVTMEIPTGLSVTAEKGTLTIVGIDKEMVGLFANKIRQLKKPEPYKGKGLPEGERDLPPRVARVDLDPRPGRERGELAGLGRGERGARRSRVGALDHRQRQGCQPLGEWGLRPLRHDGVDRRQEVGPDVREDRLHVLDARRRHHDEVGLRHHDAELPVGPVTAEPVLRHPVLEAVALGPVDVRVRVEVGADVPGRGQGDPPGREQLLTLPLPVLQEQLPERGNGLGREVQAGEAQRPTVDVLVPVRRAHPEGVEQSRAQVVEKVLPRQLLDERGQHIAARVVVDVA